MKLSRLSKKLRKSLIFCCTLKSSARKLICDRMDSDIVSILRRTKTIRTKLECLDKCNTENRSIYPEYREGSPVDRVRVSVTNAVRAKLRVALNQFQSMREKVMNEQKDELKRSYYNATGKEATDEIAEKLMAENGRQVEKGGVADLELLESQEAVSRIRKSLMGLQQVMLDMAALVEAQGDHIDDIEKNVSSTANYVKGGTNELAAANKLKKNATKWICWLSVLSLILILLCLLPLIDHL